MKTHYTEFHAREYSFLGACSEQLSNKQIISPRIHFLQLADHHDYSHTPETADSNINII